MIHDIGASASELNDDLEEKNSWVFEGKMNFNPDPSKQAQEVLFSRKLHKFLPRFLTMQAFHKQILQNIWEWY